ncbi:hyaluronidase-1 [Corythoichthys intestinalis]|uniref:hyaluronidase-1 n=1 Tax=Corythoichthys intestinalis TaxID=161448 RepID=UPI0025A58C82|nr:hyaluronidase-1 [Corythoichthys intestinalis]XP_061814049.1 hyaluronidase-1-like [Nerophis lumbriciformis]
MSGLHPILLLFFSILGHLLGVTMSLSSFSQLPFASVWNAPSSACLLKYGVDLDLGTFSIAQNQNQTFMGDDITVFYTDKLGAYPYYSQGKAVNGGVPQNTSLDEHLNMSRDDICHYIPDRDFQGLAVIDWESWRPLWERNWDTKQVYQEGSRALVRSKHTDLKPAQVDALAHDEFEAAARKFMAETLKLGQKERPGGLWGFYGFPNCYNYYKSGNYSGQCPAAESEKNNKLAWLWNVSSALYPDIYLSQELRGLSEEVSLYARHRILEALRVVLPARLVIPYATIVYTYSFQFLSQEHLVYTVGESAALGSAGVVLWGDNNFSKSKASCNAVKWYIDKTLGPYLVNVTSAAVLCSRAMCSAKGRCARRDPQSRAYLHLPATHWKVVAEERPQGGRRYTVLGQLKEEEVTFMRSKFECKCYSGWVGDSCSTPRRE